MERTVAERIRRKLEAAFDPQRLDIQDDSSRHQGHAGHRPEGETHFNVVIVSDAFVGVSRVQRQRQVYQALQEELAGPVHALSVTAMAAGEGDGD